LKGFDDMKLNRANIQKPAPWLEKGYRLPKFDIEDMVEKTNAEPIWLHMGAGNIFRIFPAMMQQDLLEAKLTDRGIFVCECYDEEIIPSAFEPHDNLTLAVTLLPSGDTKKSVVASIAGAFSLPKEKDRINEIFTAPSLQMVTLTITEKGYTVNDPLNRDSIIGHVTDGCLARYQAEAPPFALVSLDNCSQNGDVLKNALLSTAKAWVQEGWAEEGFINYISTLAFPWTMIDKITPRPSAQVAETLKVDGYEDTAIVQTKKNTFTASFVNAEEPQYLVIEDNFPNGRPPLEKAGLLFTDRETVEKFEKMKVCTCLNPLHTILAIGGCLLGYSSIAEAMKDKHLVALVKKAAYEEAMPVVVNPKIVDPKDFLREVLEERLPNPFIPDTPQRIACDSSQKIPVRFGETLKSRAAAGLPEEELEAIPFFFAMWLRYLIAVDDQGNPMELNPDPRLTELTEHLEGVYLGGPESELSHLTPILSDATIFGVNLYSTASGIIANRVKTIFDQLILKPGAVANALKNF